MIEQSTRKTGKGKTMSTEEIRKITCDGCGQTRTFVLGKDKRHEHPPWYSILPEVQFRVIGQSVTPDVDPSLNEDNYRIDACSADCAAKAFLKRLPPLPDRLPELRR
jgi:hypothetical protein